jgi:hypothetical protein
MQHKLPVYGIDRELAQRQKEKYDPQREQEAREWIGKVLQEPLPANQSFTQCLRDGKVLLAILNKVLPAQNRYPCSNSQLPFKQMENINNFLDGCTRHLAIPSSDLFQTVDLFEDKNPLQVLNAIFSFARHSTAYLAKQPPQHSQLVAIDWPPLGPKLADRHQVSFSDEQLNAGRHIPSQQSGYVAAKLAQERQATGSGIAFGMGRQISDERIGYAASTTMHTCFTHAIRIQYRRFRDA